MPPNAVDKIPTETRKGIMAKPNNFYPDIVIVDGQCLGTLSLRLMAKGT